MQPTLRRAVGPVTLPVTLGEAKRSLRLSSTYTDEELMAAVAAATETIEHRLDRVFVSQSFVWTAPMFPDGPIELAIQPIQSVSSIEYVDRDGSRQTLESSAYSLNAGNRQIYRTSSASWPQTAGFQESVEVTLLAGYGDPAAVPVIFKRLITLLAGRFFYDPAMERPENSEFAENLIAQFVRTSY